MKTVILCGNGVVDNGWKPVKQALRDAHMQNGSGMLPDSDDPEFVSFVFAVLIYELRWLHREHEANPTDSKVRDVLAKKRALYRNLTSGIKNELLQATADRTIKLRPEVEAIVDKYLPNGGPILTTNWDHLLESLVESKNSKPIEVFHLHGQVTEGDLYLPAETTEEDSYLDDDSLKRRRDATGGAMGVLGDAERLVIYGLSLSPLDAELGVARAPTSFSITGRVARKRTGTSRSPRRA